MRSTQSATRTLLTFIGVLGLMFSGLGFQATAQDDIELSYFTFSAAPDQLDTLDAMVAAFEEQNPGITINVETAPFGDYFTELQTRIAGGDAPDVFELNYENFITYASRGALLDVTDMLADDAALADAIYPQALEAFALDGAQYGLPASFSNVLVFYNQEMFDAAGVEYPTADWTWEDELAAAEQLANADEGVWGMNAPVTYNEFYKTAAQNGCEIVADDGSVTIDQPACVEALQFMVDPVANLNLQPSVADLSGISDTDLFLQGQIAMITTGIWMIPQFSDAPFAWDIALEPGNTTKAHHFFSNAVAISNDTEQVDAAWAWQGFLSASPEAAQLRIEANWELPAITDQALLDSWVEQTPPDSRHLVFEALETLVTPPPFTNQALVQDELDTLFQQVLAGELTAEEALTEAVPMIEEVLSE
ncbi:MAG: ABC transporter substrate-binding protein [Thermomicrobiales bacterium]